MSIITVSTNQFEFCVTCIGTSKKSWRTSKILGLLVQLSRKEKYQVLSLQCSVFCTELGNFQIWILFWILGNMFFSLSLSTVLASSLKRLALHSHISFSSSLWEYYMSRCNDCLGFICTTYCIIPTVHATYRRNARLKPLQLIFKCVFR